MANPYDEVAIYQFPHEIFHCIFSFLVSEDLHELVSQRWRDIAREYPPIWTNIRIFHFRDSQREMVRDLISRTKGLPLHITLEYNQYLTAPQMRNCWEILLAIMSCSSRWEALRIVVNEDLFMQICANFGGRKVPLLQRLELIAVGHSRSLLNYDLPESDISFMYLELSQAYLLKHLVLSRICLRMPSPAYMLQLESLSLDHIPATYMLDRPGLPADDPPLQTRLRNLSLTGVLISDSTLDPRAYLTEYTAFLVTLSLSGVHGRPALAVTSMLRQISTTTLRELSICDVDSVFWTGFSRSMLDPVIPRYPRLQKLHLEDIKRAESRELFNHNFPNLEILDLFNAHFTNTLTKRAVFPHLHTLRVRGVLYKELCDVVDLRIENNIPLTTLEVDTPQFLDLSSLAWLQRKVPNFKRMVNA
ncbi:hypothetical protein BDP27DRAFT_146620 [Rhodocollybia butyracea]|uniref:F-box domain-containing protein n=1 Tax=Rhodocollybia butyracea TaxID=206335 RepID=A0A9P5Q4Y2_9AGAR|nr:hypothetical protein BDP27DRAFT_146620 [Rhodocollybia butyracea]